MKVDIDLLTTEDKQALENMGIVVEDGGEAHFVKKVPPTPEGHMRLPSGKLIRRKSIQECLANNR